MRRDVVVLVITLGLLASCDRVTSVTSPDENPHFQINDAAHMGTNAHFYFLPPMVDQPIYSGEFDPTLAPEVQVCELSGATCGSVLATYTTEDGAGSETVRVVPENEHYIVNWHTDEFNLDPVSHYRITVFADGEKLGFADVDAVGGGKELKSVETGQYIALKDGRTLPIKFRVEEGALPPEIVFWTNRDGNNELYGIDSDGSGLINLTNHPASDRDPAWSPDGTRIAFTSDRGGNRDIYVMSLDGSEPDRLTADLAFDQGPSWSPDGSRIAFASVRDGHPEVYVMNADGSNQQRLTFGSANGEPDWLPDGRISFIGIVNSRPDIYVINPDGTNLVNLTGTGTEGNQRSGSSDGARIFFSSGRTGSPASGGFEIYVMNSDGTSPVRLTFNSTNDAGPDVSPDDSRLAFASDRDNPGVVWQLYVMSANGTDQVRLTSNLAAYHVAPDWRPKQ